jgi:hypothetical protein
LVQKKSSGFFVIAATLPPQALCQCALHHLTARRVLPLRSPPLPAAMLDHSGQRRRIFGLDGRESYRELRLEPL